MTAYRRGTNELFVGLAVLASIAVFVVMFAALTSRGVIRWSSDLFIALPTAEGLLKGDAVLYRGVPVGEVRDIGFTEGHVLVRATMHRQVPLTGSATASLAPVDMFGRQSIVLKAGAADGAPLADGDTIVGQRPHALMDRLDGVGRQVERFLADSTLLLLRQALTGVQGAGNGVAATTEEAVRFLAEQRRNLDQVAAAAEALARNLASATEPANMNRVRSELETALASLTLATARMDTAGQSAARILARLERGEGSLGRILQSPELHDRATAALAELEALIRDVRAEPGKFVSVSLF